MPLFEIKLEGPEVEWVHRDSPEFFDAKGQPKKVVKPALGIVLVAADDADKATAFALRQNPEYFKVLSAQER